MPFHNFSGYLIQQNLIQGQVTINKKNSRTVKKRRNQNKTKRKSIVANIKKKTLKRSKK